MKHLGHSRGVLSLATPRKEELEKNNTKKLNIGEETETLDQFRENALRCYYNQSKCNDLTESIGLRMLNRKQRLTNYCRNHTLYQHNKMQQLPKHAFVYDKQKSILGLGIRLAIFSPRNYIYRFLLPVFFIQNELPTSS